MSVAHEQTDQQSTDMDILSLCVTWAWHTVETVETVEMFMFGRGGWVGGGGGGGGGGVRGATCPQCPPTQYSKQLSQQNLSKGRQDRVVSEIHLINIAEIHLLLANLNSVQVLFSVC